MGEILFGIPRDVTLWIRDASGASAFVETGTNRAETTLWAADNFTHVFTVEAFEPLYKRAVETHGHRKNIHFLHGDSRTHIRKLVESLTEPAIFWLDAHWCGEFTFGKSDECPVAGELEALNRSAVPHVILIDDARFFIAPPPPPHEASHWPDISSMCRLLAAHDSNRYVAVYDDVIIAVPETLKLRLIEYLRERDLRRQVPANTVEPSLSSKILSKIKNLTSH